MKDMDMVLINGKVEPFMKEYGKAIRLMDMELSGIVEVTSISENFKKTKHMDLEFTFIRMDLAMKENGLKIYKKDKVRKSG